MGYDHFQSVPSLNTAFEQAKQALSPLDVKSPETQVASVIYSGSHAPVKDENGLPVPGGIRG
ncbi:MAG: hypothetical protein ACK4VI_07785 [Alphaproteobacteria bacterium]